MSILMSGVGLEPTAQRPKRQRLPITPTTHDSDGEIRTLGSSMAGSRVMPD